MSESTIPLQVRGHYKFDRTFGCTVLFPYKFEGTFGGQWKNRKTGQQDNRKTGKHLFYQKSQKRIEKYQNEI